LKVGYHIKMKKKAKVENKKKADVIKTAKAED